VDPARIGIMGFSAGGEMTSLAAMHGGPGDASATDPVDRQSSMPAFQGLIYPGRAANIQPGKDSPPAFIAAAYTDRPDISEGVAEVYLRFKRAGVPAELHIFSTGGHGFGLRQANSARPFGNWLVRFHEWLAESGFLKRAS
jgi:endo-1,4-beta-xylanase